MVIKATKSTERGIKRKNKTDPDKESLNTGISYTKYAVGGESKEVTATGLDENDKSYAQKNLKSIILL